MKNYIKELLGFKGGELKNFKTNEKEIIVWVEMLLKEHNCPNCKSTTKVNDYYERTLKDVHIYNKLVIIKDVIFVLVVNVYKKKQI